MTSYKTLRSEAARLLGNARTEKKAAAARENARKPKPRALRPLESIPCTCGGNGLEHKSTCPRGRAIRRRQKLGQPLSGNEAPQERGTQ